jgi:hypothetical protein
MTIKRITPSSKQLIKLVTDLAKIAAENASEGCDSDNESCSESDDKCDCHCKNTGKLTIYWKANDIIANDAGIEFKTRTGVNTTFAPISTDVEGLNEVGIIKIDKIFCRVETNRIITTTTSSVVFNNDFKANTILVSEQAAYDSNSITSALNFSGTYGFASGFFKGKNPRYDFSILPDSITRRAEIYYDKKRVC